MKCFADLTFFQSIRFPLLFFFIFNCVVTVLAYRRITIIDTILLADLVTHFQFVIEEPLPLGLDFGVWSFQAQVFVAAHHGVEEGGVTSSSSATALLVASLDRLRKSGEIWPLRKNGG